MLNIIKNTPSKLIVFLIIFYIALSAHFTHQKYKTIPISNDVISYYGYLPATFIYNDLTLSFIDSNKAYYAQNRMFWPETAENGAHVIKTTMGMSFLYAPFFLTAHAYTKLFTKHEANGFSEPYNVSIMVACVFYLFIGLVFLRKVLRIYYDEWTTGFTLIAIVLGTNITYYSSIELGMSHVYTFSLSCVFIYYCLKWHQKKLIQYIVPLGLIFGLIVLIRPINFLFILFFVLFKISTFNDIKYRFLLFLKHKNQIIILFLLTFLVILPQLIYWKLITGQWFFNSYTNETFYFSNPHILEGLFSYRKGWFIYTPLMFLGTLFTLFYLFKRNEQRLFWLLFLPLYIFIVFSWWCWWYGGSFGQRVMIDIYAFFAIPIAFFISQTLQKNRFIILFSFLLFYLCINMNIFQTHQYILGKIHYDAMTKKAYWTNFGNIYLENNFYNELKAPNYDKAHKGQDEYDFQW